MQEEDPYSKHLDPEVFLWILEYLHIGNHLSWGWDLSLTMKFICATCTLCTCSPKGILHRIFSAVGFWLTYHTRSGVALSNWGITSTHKNFLTWEHLKCWISSSGLLSLYFVLYPARLEPLGLAMRFPLISSPSSLGLMVCFIVFVWPLLIFASFMI